MKTADRVCGDCVHFEKSEYKNLGTCVVDVPMWCDNYEYTHTARVMRMDIAEDCLCFSPLPDEKVEES